MGILRLISGLLPNFVKGVGEGKYGEGVKAAYWAVADKKTVIALMIAMAYGVAQVVFSVMGQCVPECASAEALEQWASMIAYVPELVGVLIAVGLYDKAVRLDPPKK
jgi:hypothetical protein